MRVKVLNLALSALLTASLAPAIAETQDVSATLNISGTVNSDVEDHCTVTLNQSVINLTSSSKDLINQGADATSPERLVLTVQGPDDKWTQCDKDVYNGKIAIKFTGTHDNADGTAFANTATGENAAAGVGIGLFNYDNTPIDSREIYKIRDNTNESVNYLGLQLVKLTGQAVKTGAVAGNITFEIERL
ncbi:type 1 fimbrial protein [Cronobacter turicensis]|uniref:fimbrial protein n=1 Tax=Cronobacter turicensis TaxID=413502 RepID=UPI001412363E|nr:fimbrial protein [Cronobacter turicensis]NHV10873.1 type 1 fimbrial protein [Cronobacter turicensis]NHV64899.1 type 1 fimbrial protein [Cronobacter turicensis]NHW11840.1 type 1 fimbrial protein [Cronobacter turicensis]